MENHVKFGSHRCRLHDVTNLVSGLSNNQKGFVKYIEFDIFLYMKPYNDNLLPRNLTWWLVSKVDLKEGSLKLGDEFFNIEDSVRRLLRLPQGHDKIQAKKVSDEENDEELLKLKFQFTDGDKGKGLVGAKMLDRLKSLEDRDLFCQYFTLLALCFYLAPTNNATINQDYLRIIRHVDKIKDYDWSKFVAGYLISGIEEFRRKKSSYMKGCVHILHLIYFGHKRRTWKARSATPLIHIMRQSDLMALELDKEVITAGNLREDEATKDKVSEDADNNGPAADKIEGVCRMLKRHIEAPITTRDSKFPRYKEVLLGGLHNLASQIVQYVGTKAHSEEQPESQCPVGRKQHAASVWVEDQPDNTRELDEEVTNQPVQEGAYSAEFEKSCAMACPELVEVVMKQRERGGAAAATVVSELEQSKWKDRGALLLLVEVAMKQQERGWASSATVVSELEQSNFVASTGNASAAQEVGEAENNKEP